MRSLAAVPASHARFDEERTVHGLTVPLRSEGTLAYTRPSRIEKVTTAPRPERLTVDGDRLTLADAGGTRTVSLASQPEIAALVDIVRGTLAGDVAVLRQHYSVGLEGTETAWRLTLVPTDPHLTPFIRVVRIDGGGDAIRRLETDQTNGDSDVMTISDDSAGG